MLIRLITNNILKLLYIKLSDIRKIDYLKVTKFVIIL